ncbi:MAG: hypothetical protein CMJ90_13040 [Planctomycetes bacterium]|nr:hypothetical protein [Planctomycetota bacterium]
MMSIQLIAACLTCLGAGSKTPSKISHHALPRTERWHRRARQEDAAALSQTRQARGAKHEYHGHPGRLGWPALQERLALSLRFLAGDGNK